MAWNYVVTAHKPTAVTLGLTGYFTHSKSDAGSLPDLVVVKGRNLYFYQCESTLKPLIEISIFGNLDCLQVSRKLAFIYFFIHKYLCPTSPITFQKLERTCSAS